MTYLLPMRCLLMIEPLNANQSKVSFSKRLRYVCSEKRPYLPNWRKFIRSGIAMNNFIASIKVFSKGLCIFATDLRADRHSDWLHKECFFSHNQKSWETSNLLKKSMNYAILFTFIISRLALFFQHISSCLTIRFWQHFNDLFSVFEPAFAGSIV